MKLLFQSTRKSELYVLKNTSLIKNLIVFIHNNKELFKIETGKELFTISLNIKNLGIYLTKYAQVLYNEATKYTQEKIKMTQVMKKCTVYMGWNI